MDNIFNVISRLGKTVFRIRARQIANGGRRRNQ